MPYAKLWKRLRHEDTSILLMRLKFLEFANTTTKSNEHQFRYNEIYSTFANTATLDQEEPAIANLVRLDSYKTNFDSLQKHAESEQSADQVQWVVINKEQLPFFSQVESSANVENLDSYKFSDITTELNTHLDIQREIFITTNIEQEDSNKVSSYYLQRCEILDRFEILAQRKDNWDGFESKKPSQSTLNHAKFLIEDLLDSIISAGHPWHTPFISSDEDGYITAAWHVGERELHIEIEENEAEYTKISGTNHDMKMEIDFLNPDNFITHWEWLLDVHK